MTSPYLLLVTGQIGAVQNARPKWGCPIDWVQDCSNSSALAMELLQSCTKPSILEIINFDIFESTPKFLFAFKTCCPKCVRYYMYLR